jgi:hypothetical protein
MLHDDKDFELINHGSGPRPERRVPGDAGHGTA